jgi:integrase
VSLTINGVTHRTWTDTELDAYEKRWRLGTRERLAYDVLLYTAQRVGDVVRMQRNEIRNGVIAVVQEKTGTEVFVPLHPALARSIKAGPSKGVYLIGDKNGRPNHAHESNGADFDRGQGGPLV